MTLGLRNALISIFVFFLCLFLFIRFAGPISIDSVTTTKTDFFTANGVGEVNATPTSANFSVGVNATAPTEAEAKNQMNSITNKVIDDLKSLGIPEKDMKTTNVNIYQNPEPQQFYPATGSTGAGPQTSLPALPIHQVKPGFTATENLEVKANSVELANKAFDTATADGANQVSGVSFTLDDATQKLLTNKARKLAIQDAKKNAQELASEAGIHLGRIVNITDSSPQPIYNRSMAAMGKQDSINTNLQPGQNKVSASVTLYYDTR